MRWTPWNTSSVAVGRPPKPRTDQEPIALGPLPSSVLLDPAGQRAREARAAAEKVKKEEKRKKEEPEEQQAKKQKTRGDEGMEAAAPASSADPLGSGEERPE